jgi:hypothetical protein
MPALMAIDALIFLGWSSILVAFILKVVDISTAYRAEILGLSAKDFLWASGIALLFALSLAARTWVKANEPRMLRERWRRLQGPEVPGGWNGESVRLDEELRGANHALEAAGPVRTVRRSASNL